MEVAPPHKILYTQRVSDVDGTDGESYEETLMKEH